MSKNKNISVFTTLGPRALVSADHPGCLLTQRTSWLNLQFTQTIIILSNMKAVRLYWSITAKSYQTKDTKPLNKENEVKKSNIY